MSRKWCCLVLIVLFGVSLTQRVFATATASITIGGAEQYSSSAAVWDNGTVTVSVNGYLETVPYGRYSTPSSIASALAVKFSQDCNAPTNARATGAVISFQGRGTVANLTLEYSVTGNAAAFAQNSFVGNVLSGSTSSGPIITDITPAVDGRSVTITGSNFGSSGTVTFDGTPATTSSWSNTTISAMLSGSVPSGLVVVTTGGSSSNVFVIDMPVGCPVS